MVADSAVRQGDQDSGRFARDLVREEHAWTIGRKLVDAFGQPFMLRGGMARVGITAGFALAPLDGSDSAALLRRADAGARVA